LRHFCEAKNEIRRRRKSAAAGREWIKDASLLDGIVKNDDLPSKKSSLQKIFGSNLTLRNKKVEEILVKQWATLCVALKNFSENQRSFILAVCLE
jgi:hypothetical protein